MPTGYPQASNARSVHGTWLASKDGSHAVSGARRVGHAVVVYAIVGSHLIASCSVAANEVEMTRSDASDRQSSPIAPLPLPKHLYTM